MSVLFQGVIASMQVVRFSTQNQVSSGFFPLTYSEYQIKACTVVDLSSSASRTEEEVCEASHGAHTVAPLAVYCTVL